MLFAGVLIIRAVLFEVCIGASAGVWKLPVSVARVGMYTN